MTALEDLGRMALGSRLKRLSSDMFAQTTQLYKDLNIDMDATCFPLLNVVSQKAPLNLRDAQTLLGTSHADISQKTAILKKNGLITVEQDPRDKRSRSLNITDKGCTLMQQAKPLWQALDRALAQLLHPHEEAFFNTLSTLEKHVREGHYIDLCKTTLHPKNGGGITIIPYRAEHKQKFRDINAEWLSKYFTIEQVDEDLFNNPETKIIQPGGMVFMAQLETENGAEIVGTCALYKNSATFELCKMGVDPRYRGMGIAGELIKASLHWAKNHNADMVYLLTSSKLKSAHSAYKKHGFTEIPVTKADQEKYSRADVRMEITL